MGRLEVRQLIKWLDPPAHWHPDSLIYVRKMFHFFCSSVSGNQFTLFTFLNSLIYCLLLVSRIRWQIILLYDFNACFVIVIAVVVVVFDISSLTWCFFIFTSESVMPAKATLFNIKCESLFDFGTGPRNDVFYNPHGNNILKRDMLSRISGKSIILN